MFKLMGKKIFTILRLKILFILTYDTLFQQKLLQRDVREKERRLARSWPRNRKMNEQKMLVGFMFIMLQFLHIQKNKGHRMVKSTTSFIAKYDITLM